MQQQLEQPQQQEQQARSPDERCRIATSPQRWRFRLLSTATTVCAEHTMIECCRWGHACAPMAPPSSPHQQCQQCARCLQLQQCSDGMSVSTRIPHAESWCTPLDIKVGPRWVHHSTRAQCPADPQAYKQQQAHGSSSSNCTSNSSSSMGRPGQLGRLLSQAMRCKQGKQHPKDPGRAALCATVLAA
jgi:hypothetical protein